MKQLIDKFFETKYKIREIINTDERDFETMLKANAVHLALFLSGVVLFGLAATIVVFGYTIIGFITALAGFAVFNWLYEQYDYIDDLYEAIGTTGLIVSIFSIVMQSILWVARQDGLTDFGSWSAMWTCIPFLIASIVFTMTASDLPRKKWKKNDNS